MDQQSLNNVPIVFASLSLPSGFAWSDNAEVTVTSNEDGGGAVPATDFTVTTSGNTISISGLNFRDVLDDVNTPDTVEDPDILTEFTISIHDPDITALGTVKSGSYGVSSQYRTNPDRRIKDQTWVLSQPDLIDVEVTHSITWDSEDADTPSSGGSTFYTTGSTVTNVPTSDPVKAGYTFAGWWTGDNGTGVQVTNGTYTPSTPYGAITLYAKWTLVGA